jgi:hypothetical protein
MADSPKHNSEFRKQRIPARSPIRGFAAYSLTPLTPLRAGFKMDGDGE